MTPETNPEFRQQLALEKLRNAMKVIKQANVPDISAMAEDAMQKVDTGEVKIVYASLPVGPRIPTRFCFSINFDSNKTEAATESETTEVATAGRSVVPTLVLNPDAILATHDETIIATDF